MSVFSKMDRPLTRVLALLGLTSGLAIGLAGCSADETGRVFGQAVGAATGAVAGGYLGNQIGSGIAKTIATSVGAAMGAYFGSKLFDELAAPDRERAAVAQADALESAASNTPVPWRNPDASVKGEVTVQSAKTVGDQYPCREFTHVIDTAGKPIQANGTACRADDGSWAVLGAS